MCFQSVPACSSLSDKVDNIDSEVRLWQMQRNTWYFTIITATNILSNCVFSEPTCMLNSVGHCLRRHQFRSKIVDNCKEILGILQLSLLRTCFQNFFFQSVPVFSSLSDNVDEEIDLDVRL